MQLPSLLVLVDAHFARSEDDDEQEAANDRYGLKEVVAFEVVLVRHVRVVHVPVGVTGQVEHGEHDAERESARLGPVADNNEHDEQRAGNVEHQVGGGAVEAQQCQVHEYDEIAAGQVHELARLVIAKRGHVAEERLRLGLVLHQQQQEAAHDRQVAQARDAVVPRLIDDHLSSSS